MTPQAQQIAIAEACGYAGCPRQWVYDCWETGCAAGVIEGTGRWEKDTSKLPDYLNDLNAMHEAEETSYIFKSWRDTERWLNALEIAVIGRRAESRPDLAFVFRATAAQRAEAFLHTLNLWDDSR
jgi:hypothetical protein